MCQASMQQNMQSWTCFKYQAVCSSSGMLLTVLDSDHFAGCHRPCATRSALLLVLMSVGVPLHEINWLIDFLWGLTECRQTDCCVLPWLMWCLSHQVASVMVQTRAYVQLSNWLTRCVQLSLLFFGRCGSPCGANPERVWNRSHDCLCVRKVLSITVNEVLFASPFSVTVLTNLRGAAEAMRKLWLLSSLNFTHTRKHTNPQTHTHSS